MKRLALAIVVVASACRVRDTFICMTSEQCRFDAAFGICEATGYCSFPDSHCSSGQRYHPSAGEGLADTCVIRDARSCHELLVSMPGTPSGMYSIDPDGLGTDAPFDVFCDMTTTPVGEPPGGWTLVFVPTSSNYNATTIDYTSYTRRLLDDATTALIANRKADLAVTGNHASFPLPDEWRSMAPFKATATDLSLPVTVTSPMMTGQTSTEQLRFGFSNWSTDCAGAWYTTASRYGRICVSDTKAPFFNAFAETDGDYCVESTDTYYATACSPSLMFTIAVR